MGVDDEPTRLFFCIIQEKQIRESMTLFITNINTILEEEEDILQEVESFYTTLCTTSGSTMEVKTTRREIIGYVTTCITEDQQVELEKYPIEEEVRKIVKALPCEKAPGLDGMTSEVLSACWSFVKDCMAMLL